ERQENIAGLIRFASAFHDAGAFLEQVALLQAHDEPGAQGKESRKATSGDSRGKRMTNGSVVLSTIHLAKGLEFDRVFVAGVSEGLLPHARALETEGELEEERRLMYVAMTRARKELTISFSDIPSRFISELPEEHYVFQSLHSHETRFADSEERYITLD
ncbi:MAG: 3'-5' exonuclease, partial [Patescibacteria group bacterium]